MAQLSDATATRSLLLQLNPDWFYLSVPADLGSPRKRAVKWLCVCVYFSHNFRLVHVHCVPKAVHLLFFEQLCRKLTDINYFGIVLNLDQV